MADQLKKAPTIDDELVQMEGKTELARVDLALVLPVVVIDKMVGDAQLLHIGVAGHRVDVHALEQVAVIFAEVTSRNPFRPVADAVQVLGEQCGQLLGVAVLPTRYSCRLQWLVMRAEFTQMISLEQIMGLQVPAPRILRVEELEGFRHIVQGHGHDLALVQEEVDMHLGEVRTGNDAGHLKVIAVDVLLRDLAAKAWVHHRLLKFKQALLQVFAFELFFFVTLNQRTGRQQQADSPLLAVDDVPCPTLLMKNDSAQAVGGLVLVDGDIGEQLVDILPGPLVGTLVLGNIQRRIHKQFIDTDDLAG